MTECESIARCGFFHKYQKSFDLACRGFINAYCRGPKMEECERRKYKITNGMSPDDDMMLTGQMMPKSMRG